MRYFYDLHLHSCLSPCGDMDMTPNNITGMASLLGLQIIALTDHNTCRNCGATIEAGKRNGVVVVPGMELTTSEDIHAVCLFPTLEKAMDWDEYVDAHRIKIKNRPDIYGRQVLMNAEDEEIGEIEHLLLPGTEISIMNAYRKVKAFGGICYPACRFCRCSARSTRTAALSRRSLPITQSSRSCASFTRSSTTCISCQALTRTTLKTCATRRLRSVSASRPRRR